MSAKKKPKKRKQPIPYVGLSIEDLEGLTELGQTELQECCDTGRRGLIIWLGTADRPRAQKIANRIIKNVNASPYGPIARLREIRA